MITIDAEKNNLMLLERLFGKLGGRLSKTDISEACRMTQGERNNDRKEALSLLSTKKWTELKIK